MAGQGGAHRDLGGLAVTDLADADDIGVLTQHGTQRAGKGHADLFVDLHLRGAVKLDFDRVLERDQVGGLADQLLGQCIHGRGFTGARGADDQDNAAGRSQQFVDLAAFGLGQTDAGAVEHRGVAGEQTDNGFFTVDRGQRAETHIHLSAVEHHHRAAVLRNALFCDIDMAHDLQTRGRRVLELRGDRQDLVQDAVNTDAYHHVALGRLEVNIRGVFFVGALDNRIDQPDRRAVLLALLRLGGGADTLFGNAGLGAHLRDGLGSLFVAVQGVDGVLDRRTAGDHGDDLLLGDLLGLLDRVEVQRVLHRDEQRVFRDADGHNAVADSHRLRDPLGHLDRDIDLAQINKVNPQLIPQCVDQLILGNEAVVDQRLAKALALLLLQPQGLHQLVVRNDLLRYQNIA